MKSLLKLSATTVHSKCKKMYTKQNGLGIGGSFAVKLANF